MLWIIVASVLAIPGFMFLAFWNGSVAVIFAICVLTWLLFSLSPGRRRRRVRRQRPTS